MDTIELPIWFVRRTGDTDAMSFPSVEDAGRYVEFYNPVTNIEVDLAHKWLILDNSGRRLDIVIDNCVVLRCDLASQSALPEDTLLLESARGKDIGRHGDR